MSRWAMRMCSPIRQRVCGTPAGRAPRAVAGTAAPPDAKSQPKPDAKSDAKAEEEAEVKANLAKLSPEDRKLAEKQRYCAVEGDESRLGAMGPPVKVMVKGKPVFICCKS